MLVVFRVHALRYALNKPIIYMYKLNGRMKNNNGAKLVCNTVRYKLDVTFYLLYFSVVVESTTHRE